MEHFLLVVVAQTALRHLGADRLAMLTGQCERVRDPAIRIYHMPRHRAVVDTRYGIA